MQDMLLLRHCTNCGICIVSKLVKHVIQALILHLSIINSFKVVKVNMTGSGEPSMFACKF